MAQYLSLLGRQFNLLTFLCMCMMSSPAIQCDPNSDSCPKGQYCDRNDRQCYACCSCPSPVIRFGTSGGYSSISSCSRHGDLCPKWCSVHTTPDPGDTDAIIAEVCEKPWSSVTVPAVIFVNVTVLSRYNSATKTYTAECTSFSVNFTPTLKWYSPAGELITGDPSSIGMVKLIRGEMNQTLTLTIDGFKKKHTGFYMCKVEGNANVNSTVYLEFVEDTTSTNTPITLTASGWLSTENSLSVQETKTNRYNLTEIIIICVLAAVLVGCGCGVVTLRMRSPSSSQSHDVEKDMLLSADQSITMVTTEFSKGKICGLAVLWMLPGCAGIIVKRNNEVVARVRNAADQRNRTLDVDHLQWNDTIVVLMEVRRGWCTMVRRTVKTRVKELKMNCLEIPNSTITMTSAVVKCPKIEGTFSMRLEPMGTAHVTSAEGIQTISGGEKVIQNLRPNVHYLVELFAKEGDIISHWTEEFLTKCPRLELIRAEETCAQLRWSLDGITDSTELYVGVNCLSDDRLVRVSDINVGEYKCRNLVPGFEQSVQLKIKEDGHFRLLDEKSFRTKGSVPSGGNYDGDITTEHEDLDPLPTRRRNHPRQGTAHECTMGLLEAVQTLRERSYHLYYRAEPRAVAMIISELKEQSNQMHMLHSRKRGLEVVEDFLRKSCLDRTCSTFDVMRRFIASDGLHSQAEIDFALELAKHHSTCRVCHHAVYILQKRKMSEQPSTQA